MVYVATQDLLDKFKIISDECKSIENALHALLFFNVMENITEEHILGFHTDIPGWELFTPKDKDLFYSLQHIVNIKKNIRRVSNSVSK